MTSNLLAVTLTVSCAATLAGCWGGSTSADVTAAPGATDPACTAALAAAPATVAGLARTPLPVAGALAWGEPAVVLRCGLPAATPTRDRCLGVNDVDWVVDTAGDPYVFVTYGRTPAVELRVPAKYGNDDASAAISDVGPVAAALPRNGRSCIGPGDATGPATPSGTIGASRSGGAAASPSSSVSASPSGG